MGACCRAWRALPAAVALAVLSAGAAALGPWRATRENTPGWAVMTPAERIEYQRRMRALQTLADCRVFQTEHRARVLALERERERERAPERTRERLRGREPAGERAGDPASASERDRPRDGDREQARLRLRGQPVPDTEALCQQLLHPNAPR